MRLLLALIAVAVAACGPSRPAPGPPRDPVTRTVDAAPDDEPAADATGAAITPRAYALELAIDPEAQGYTGTVSIDLDVAARSSAIWLDAAELEVTWARLTVGAITVVLDVLSDPPDGRLGLALPAPIEPGAARLTIAFAGIYRDDDGIFAQTYRAGSYVFSDFEPVDARRAFPCFDEPRFKTPWTVSLVVPDGVVALSNAAETATEPLSGGVTRVTFEPTPPLPTYLVAIAVGEFDVVDAPGGSRPMRIVMPSGRGDAAARAAAFAPELLEVAAALLDREVPFAKLDVIAVPRFGGAMENPGLITIALDLLTGDDRQLALVLAHEVAHLWFGDSVTLTDWRDLWIQEGLATWMADEVLARWRPAWNTRLGEVAARHEAMAEDDTPGAHALRPDALDGPRALFDLLTYQKAAAVLHMIEAWTGEDAFRDALRGYLDAHAGAGAGSADLLAALGALDDDVGAVLAPLLDRPGVPVVEARLTCTAGAATLALSVRDAAGPVPACVRWRDDAGVHRACAVVSGASELALGASCPRWVQPNADGAGYYRWWLEGGALAAVIGDARATDRERLDATRAVRGAVVDGTPLAEIAAALAAGVRSGVPEIATAAVADYRVLIDQAAPADAVEAIAAHLRRAVAPGVKRLGTAARDDDTDETRRLRGALLAAAGLAGDRKVITWATRTTRRWLDGGRRPPADLLDAALSIAAAHADTRMVTALTDAATTAHLDGSDDAPRLGHALGRLPATAALAALGSALAGDLPSMITFTVAYELLLRRDTVTAAAAELAVAGDWLQIALTFAPVCDPALVDQAAHPDELTRRRADAARCAALTPALTNAAKAFK